MAESCKLKAVLLENDADCISCKMDPFDAIGGQFSCIRGPLSRHQTRNLGYDSKQWMLFNNVAFSLNVLFQFDRMAFDYDCDCVAREVEVRTGHLVVGHSISNDDDDVVFAERTIDQQGERQRVPGFFTMNSDTKWFLIDKQLEH